MGRLQNQFASIGARPMLVSAFYGRKFSDTIPMTRDEELAYDKHVWLEEDGVTVPIALAPGDGPVKETWRPKYVVAGIPLYVFVDRAGIIRYVHWTNGRNFGLLEPRFASVIKKIAADDAKLGKAAP
jgi:hypothetical protein